MDNSLRSGRLWLWLRRGGAQRRNVCAPRAVYSRAYVRLCTRDRIAALARVPCMAAAGAAVRSVRHGIM